MLRKLLDFAEAERAAKRGGGTAPLSLDRPWESADADGPTLREVLPGPDQGPQGVAEAAELRQRIGPCL